ncbi:acyl-CoA dehydrogenase family protein [Paraliomyxa miuraensis]|uniref:acyl-CoA dehydrogenase family protein n=1 Tax=Paraliomyxa miuraensis TaxID=376150 RepID=UPI00225B2949|nr:acyl-CoA dehydrogenase family protein [Paraliomyxa miuraensis]MCX4245177.1 acyl-CoA dehydrogenase family protein [Paraliomyxa miuraensis]
MTPRTIFEPEHELFRDSVRKFFRAEVSPQVERWRSQGVVDRETFLAAGRQGYLLMWAPEELGGMGITDMRYEQILQEENYLHGDPGLCLTLHSRVVAPYIGHHGTDEQKQRWLPAAAAGEAILAVAMSEPAAGSDLAGMQTHAEERGDHWVLHGSKTYISNGLLADLVIVAARTSPDSRHAMGLFVVEAGMAGFERGRKLVKMGLDAQDTAEMFFDQVAVPKANVLGDPTQGFRYLAQALAVERLQIAIGAIAHAQVAFELTLSFVKERRAFGRPVGTFQNPRFRLARMRAEIDATQAYVDHCVMLANAGTLTAEVASAAKMLATELEGRVIDDCLQLHGGAGYMEEYRICRMYRDARVTRIFGGTNEIMAEIIGRHLGLDERKLGLDGRKSREG